MLKQSMNFISPRQGIGLGLRYWILQQASALIISSYVIFLVGWLMLHPDLQYSSWKDLFTSISMRIFSTILIVNISCHSWIGLWGVITDYVKHPASRLGALSVVLILTSIYFVWGSAIIWSL